MNYLNCGPTRKIQIEYCLPLPALPDKRRNSSRLTLPAAAAGKRRRSTLKAQMVVSGK